MSKKLIVIFSFLLPVLFKSSGTLLIFIMYPLSFFSPYLSIILYLVGPYVFILIGLIILFRLNKSNNIKYIIIPFIISTLIFIGGPFAYKKTREYNLLGESSRLHGFVNYTLPDDASCETYEEKNYVLCVSNSESAHYSRRIKYYGDYHLDFDYRTELKNKYKYGLNGSCFGGEEGECRENLKK